MAHEQELKQAMALTCGMIGMIDDAVGELLVALQRAGRYDDTVVIFTSDHGDYLGDFNLLLKGALPLRGITRVPLLWSDPAHRNGCVSKVLASTLDLAPSIIERAGLNPYWGIQGNSLSAQLQGSDEPQRDALLIEYQDTKKRMGFPEPAFVRSLQTDDYRLTVYKDQSWGELYNLHKDPYETYNCWDDAQYAGVRAELSERLLQCMMNAVDQSPRARWLA
jgi:arylsulfatase A-like enzyme